MASFLRTRKTKYDQRMQIVFCLNPVMKTTLQLYGRSQVYLQLYRKKWYIRTYNTTLQTALNYTTERTEHMLQHKRKFMHWSALKCTEVPHSQSCRFWSMTSSFRCRRLIHDFRFWGLCSSSSVVARTAVAIFRAIYVFQKRMCAGTSSWTAAVLPWELANGLGPAVCNVQLSSMSRVIIKHITEHFN